MLLFTEMFRGVDIQSKKICPQFADFQFLNWNQDDEVLHIVINYS